MIDPTITSTANTRVKGLRRLARGHASDEPGTAALLEGVRLVEEALEQGHALREVWTSPRLERSERGASLRERLAALPAIELVRASDQVLASVSAVESHQGVLALLAVPRHDAADVAAGDGPLVLAFGVQDPGNLGALMRVAEATGAAGMLCSGGAGPWTPRVLRASAGSALRLPLAPLPTPARALEVAAGAGRPLIASVGRGGTDLFSTDLPRNAALLVGGEGAGLDEAVVRRSDQEVTIPMEGAVESLNVVVAAALVLYELKRSR